MQESPFQPDRRDLDSSSQIYRNVSSLAVTTLRPDLRVARFNAERTFSLLSAKSASGTFSAVPLRTRSRSETILPTICLCFPLRPWGTSVCRIDLKFIGDFFFVAILLHPQTPKKP